MSGWTRRLLYVLVAVVLIALIAGLILLPRSARASFPQIEGEIRLEGLDGPVDIYRDKAGIPHIFASTEHDLYFAQGYVHAQDRFWQMDFQRHASSGRLSEMLGNATLDTDVFLRTLGWERIAREELKSLDAQTLATLEAYAEGVNAYLAERSGSELSLEYLFLALLNRNYQPAPWEPLNTVSWAKAMAWDLKANMEAEIQRAQLLQSFSRQQIAELFPAYPDEHPVVVPDFEMAATAGGARLTSVDYAELAGPLALSAERFAALDALLGSFPEAGLGSNSWVVSGELTASGAPLLANDPHLSASMPSIWYQNGLHCMPKSADCNVEVSGVSFVGAPGVIIGHNARIAWSFTNVGPDVMDLFIIKVNPENPNQYELNGEWVDMEVVEEEIVVAGRDPVLLSARLTSFGPIISDSYGSLLEFETQAGIELPESYAIALRWTALEPSYILRAVLKINRAQNWEEFREATREFSVPSQNLLYADVDGNIGYQMPGNIPIRAAGDGRYPAPGWTDDYAWLGYIPFEELPYVYNPPSGYIVTANNAVVSGDYPYFIADAWDYGYRAQRIVDMVESIGGGFDVQIFEAMQADNLNLGALEVLPYLLQVDFEDQKLVDMRELLADWDGQQSADSAPSALFNAFWKQLLAATFHDQLPEEDWPEGNSRWFAVMENLLQEADSIWWDDQRSAEVEGRDEIIATAFAAAVEELEKELGADPAKWAWGDLHTITFRHQVMGNFPIINLLFDRGPYALAGGSAIVNANNWDTSSGTYAVESLPSKRSIMDLADWQNSLQIHTTGQSGHAYHPHYADMAPTWAVVDSLPMHWELTAIQADAEGHLRLLPE